MSTISPPGASFPPGTNLPHVPAPSREGLPPGEGCYHCDINEEGIPLEKPLKALNLRHKRDVDGGEGKKHKNHTIKVSSIFVIYVIRPSRYP